MKGDFTRNTFDPNKHFLRVLMQQGRVQLDADWNEQASILLHYLQTLAADIIGPYAGPAADSGFEISLVDDQGDFNISKGRYYVNGLLCENEKNIAYLTQADYPLSEDDALSDGNYVVYLDVWERHISFVEDDSIREKALNGVDTATRSKTVWQVKVKELEGRISTCNQSAELLNEDALVLSQICMSARAKQGRRDKQPCLTEPEAQFRGPENQLYRVEIHDGNIDENGRLNEHMPTFKFSRENGSTVFPVLGFIYDASSKTATVTVEHLGRDEKLGLAVNDWVELVDDKGSLHNKTMPLLRVQAIDVIDKKVTLSGDAVEIDLNRHALLRRWDQHDEQGVIELRTGEWLKLEDGIEVKFRIEDAGRVRSGDYWLIPARVATGDVEWPVLTDGNGAAVKDINNNLVPKAMPPQGIKHQYAPLAIVNAVSGRVSDCRCSFMSLSGLCTYSYYGQLGIGVDLICPDEENS